VYKPRKTLPYDDHGIIHPSFNEEGYYSSKPIPSSNTVFSTEELDEVLLMGSAETDPRSNTEKEAPIMRSIEKKRRASQVNSNLFQKSKQGLPARGRGLCLRLL
jgi:hypothetical protein